MIGEEHQLLWEPESQGQADTPEHVQQPFGVHEFLNKQRRANTLIINLTGTLPLLYKLFGIDNLFKIIMLKYNFQQQLNFLN